MIQILALNLRHKKIARIGNLLKSSIDSQDPYSNFLTYNNNFVTKILLILNPIQADYKAFYETLCNLNKQVEEKRLTLISPLRSKNDGL